MVVLNGVQNFLQFLSDNWTAILVCIGLIIGIIKKTKDYFSKSNEERIEIAKKQIQEVILRMVTDAEIDFEEWNKSGSIKRSQVIEEIFTNYPILSKAVSQEDIIAWIDEQIDSSLETLRDIINKNKS